MLSDEEKVKLVEKNIPQYNLQKPSKMYFCISSLPDVYFIVSYVEEDDSPEITYHQFNRENLLAFIDDIRNKLSN